MNLNSTIVSKPPVATEKDLRRCKAIESLLVQPLGVLPTEIGDPIRPVTIGFFQQVSTLLKPDARVTALRRAVGAYVHSKRYYLSCCLADAMRHDLDGKPFEPVSDTDRLNAEERLYASGQQTNIVPTSLIAPSPISEAQSKRDLIRAALLGKSPG
ncbi:ProP effector [Ochrobactrum sp. BH3]|uniref:ProQ/FINO family protein n=1 Tax=Brucella pituitosa TaxID=571256 RepID=UPI000C27CBBE|nr:ProQ/FINO family protein [Brucella pituitosa]PJO49388.1 ProQ/FINO family protein [Brucella pituitosa]TCQ70120.1 ProP effector [Ochrobactrum sp. BH3]